MKKAAGPDNPFGSTPKGLVFEYHRDAKVRGAHLDYGTYNGDFVAALSKAGLVETAVGVDVNAAMVERSRSNMPKNVTLEVIRKGAPLAFSDDAFDTISIIGVIEHVADQARLLNELKRILKPGGLLIIAVPGQHLFSFLDLGNLKFRFPTLHKYAYTKLYGRERYAERYVERKNGLFGDIEVEKMWHEHFSYRAMERLLGRVGMSIESVDGLGYFQRIFRNLAFAMGGGGHVLKAMMNCDARWFKSCELVFIARKQLG